MTENEKILFGAKPKLMERRLYRTKSAEGIKLKVLGAKSSQIRSHTEQANGVLGEVQAGRVLDIYYRRHDFWQCPGL